MDEIEELSVCGLVKYSNDRKKLTFTGKFNTLFTWHLSADHPVPAERIKKALVLTILDGAERELAKKDIEKRVKILLYMLNKQTKSAIILD